MTTEKKIESSSPRELDLSEHVLADFWSNHESVVNNLRRGQRALDNMKICNFKVNILPGQTTPAGDIVWECEVPIVSEKVHDTARDVVYKGQAAFFRETKMISVVAADARRKVAFLFAPRGQPYDIPLESYLVANIIIFPRECSVRFCKDDIDRPIRNVMESHEFKLELSRQRIDKEDDVINPAIVKRECKIRWPFGSGFRFVTNCEAAYDYGTWGICITGEDIRIELKRVHWACHH